MFKRKPKGRIWVDIKTRPEDDYLVDCYVCGKQKFNSQMLAIYDVGDVFFKHVCKSRKCLRAIKKHPCMQEGFYDSNGRTAVGEYLDYE